MSSERSNSAVRNLRSIFENKASENSPNARGRSPGSLGGDLDRQQRPKSKVRASFIPVEPTMAALAAEQDIAENELTRQTSADKRRPSFSEGHSGEALDKMKETVGSEQERRDQESSVAETIPETAVESAAPTPAVEAIKELGSAVPKVEKEDKEAANPDKPVTGAEEEPVDMKPADPASESAVSGGEALPPVAEDLRKTSKSTKPSSILTKAKAAASSLKSPVSTSSAAPTKKSSRSSLTAPTAASVARQAAADKQAAAPKPKPREVTKPVEVSSRLTAPTAASRARLESATSAPAPNVKPAAALKAKPTSSARPTPRQSLAGRSDSHSSQKPAAAVDGSFLERMTRPTAASANRAHEKTEVKSPTRQKQLPIRPKTNGASKPKPTAAVTAGAAETEDDVTAVEDAPALPEDELQQTEAAPVEASEPTGNETPLPNTNGHSDEAPESTPAAIGTEETIR